MKRTYLAILLLLSAALGASAQHTPLQKYDVVPLAYEHIFMDAVQDFPSVLIDMNGGQYVGQANKRYSLYGYGQYINDSGDFIIGKFREGSLICGISMSKENATIGNKDFHCSYSLSTGELQYVFRRENGELSEVPNAQDYTFMSQTFENGDRYVGEFYKGKRHGLGIYYYATGGLWYGTFQNDIRDGFGAWFKTDNDMVIGIWEGDDERRRAYIPVK